MCTIHRTGVKSLMKSVITEGADRISLLPLLSKVCPAFATKAKESTHNTSMFILSLDIFWSCKTKAPWLSVPLHNYAVTVASLRLRYRAAAARLIKTQIRATEVFTLFTLIRRRDFKVSLFAAFLCGRGLTWTRVIFCAGGKTCG